MATRTYSCILIATMLVAFEWGTFGAETGAPKTVEEAKAKRDKILAAANQPGKLDPLSRSNLAAPILQFLNSENPAIRKIALDALDSISQIPFDAAVPYLSEDRPLSERVPLLALCFEMVPYPGNEAEDKIRLSLKTTLKGEVCPPSLDLLIPSLAMCNKVWLNSKGATGVVITDLVDKPNRKLVGQRVLHNLSQVRLRKNAQHYSEVRGLKNDSFDLVIMLGEEYVGASIEDWYRVEPDVETRKIIVSEGLAWDKLPEWAARRKAVLEIAVKDWDASISERAKALLSGTRVVAPGTVVGSETEKKPENGAAVVAHPTVPGAEGSGKPENGPADDLKR